MNNIVLIKKIYILPILKNGHTSIKTHAEKHKCPWFTYNQCAELKNIQVFLRSPLERFVSGVHSYIEFEKRKTPMLDYYSAIEDIRKNRTMNKHFAPQFMWISDLSKYFKGVLSLKDIEELRSFIPEKEKPKIPPITETQKAMISEIPFKGMNHDKQLYKHVGHDIEIAKLVERITNVLS